MIKNDKNVYYRNVHLFCERIRNLIVIKSEELIRINLNICFFDYAFIWYISKLKILSRIDLRSLFLENDWIRELKLRFKFNHSVVIDALVFERYILIDVRSDRESFNYVQQIVSHVMNVNFQNTHQQLTWTWKNLDFNLKRDISTSNDITSLTNFLHLIENKKKVWQKLYTRDENWDDRDRRFNNRQINKSSRQNSNRDDHLSFDDVYAFQFQYFFANWYYNSNSTYQNQNFQSRQSFEDYAQQRVQFAIVLSIARQSLFFKVESESNSNQNSKQKNKSNVEKFQKFDKIKIFLVDENDENVEFEKVFQDNQNNDSSNYFASSKNLVYYESSSYNESNDENDVVYFISSKISVSKHFHCRKCDEIFSFNNKLHQHIRKLCTVDRENSSLSMQRLTDVIVEFFKRIEINSSTDVLITKSNLRKSFFIKIIKNSFTIIDVVDSIKKSVTNLTSNSENVEKFFVESLSIIFSNVDFNKNVDIDYKFRKWKYVRVSTTLSFIIESKHVCLDTNVNIILVDREFFKRQTSNISIRTMTISISIRDLDTAQHWFSDYVIIFIYFSSKKNEIVVKVMITREIHLIDNLRINMLIENDLMKSKKIDINVTKRIVHIDSCDVIVALNVKISRTIVHTSIHARKTIIVFSHIEIVLSIHFTTISANRNFLFEWKNLNLSLYVHLTDVEFKNIVVKNDNDKFVHISRNCRVKRMIELDFSNAYVISTDDDNDVVELAVRKFFTKHKTNWFKRVIVATYVVIVVITSISLSIVNTSITTLNSLITENFFSTDYIVQASLSVSQIFDVIMSNVLFASTSSFASKVIFNNDITIHRFNDVVVQTFIDIVEEYSNLWKKTDFVDLSKENWMRIFLKIDWKSRISDKVKIYSLSTRDKELIDVIFDKLHEFDKLNWIEEFTSFSYLVFCVWKNVNDEKKRRIIVDIRELNVIIQFDVYSLSLQIEMIFVVFECQYIIVIDCSTFFYQWRVHSKNRHKLTMINHRNQKFFNVAIMKYKNSLVYVQRQIDRLFRSYRHYVKTYVDDIVIYFKTLDEHKIHLRSIFDMFKINNISIKSKKIFIDYFTVHLLKQKMNFLELTTTEKKLKTISRLSYSKTLQSLKIYLKLIEWLRDYVFMYVDVAKSFQKLKIELLRNASVTNNVKKIFSRIIRMKNFISRKLASFQIFQTLLSKSFYLIHVDSTRRIYIDLNVSKKFDLNVMMYHVKKSINWDEKDYSSRKAIESILFLSRILFDLEIRYWFTELKFNDIVWILRKIRHLLDFFLTKSFVVFIDHDVVLEIIKQINMIIVSIDKLNFRLVKTFDYIQRFELKIRHKSDKQHIVFDALFRLVNTNIDVASIDESELDVLFIIILVQMKKDFRRKLIANYITDLNWKKISDVLKKQIIENNVHLSFYRENDLIFRSDDITSDDHAFESRRLCIFATIISNILTTTHDESHVEFARCYEKIASFYYIRNLSRYLRDFLKHCLKCQIFQTRRHRFYDSLQLILTSSIFFHTITIDFILILLSSFTTKKFDCLMSISCKYSKRILMILEKIIWTTI